MQDFDDLASNTSSRHSRANALGAGAANSSKQLVFPEPTTTKLLTKYFPLFPILLTFKRANLRVVSTIGLVLFAMQHWAFVLNPRMKDHLGYQLGNVIAYIVYGSQLSFYDPVMVASASVTAFLVVVYLLLAVTLVLVGCILFHLRPMDDHSEGKGITSDAARLLLNVMSTALLIPILQFCFASCVCGSSGYMWMLPNVENAVCWGSSHIAAFIPSLICLIVLIPLLYLKNTCVYDYAILSDTFQSRRHSVVEKMTFVRDVMSCLLFNVMLGWEVPLGFTILHAIFSGLLVLSYMFFLPYYSMWMNRFYVCVHTIECLLSVFVSCSLNVLVLNDGAATTALFLGAGTLVTTVLFLCTDVRVSASYYCSMKQAAQCSHVGSILDENDADANESDSSNEGDVVVHVDDAAVEALTYPEGLVLSNTFCQYVGLNRQVMESIAQQELNMMVKGGVGTVRHKTFPILEPYVSHVYVDTDVALAASSIDLYAMRFEPEQLSDMMLVYGANIYSRALTTFADNAEVMLAFAAFITSYLPGLSFMGVDLVKRALRGRITIDQQFRCLRQANQLRVALGIRTHAHSIRSLKARAAHGRALQSIHKFWVKLTEPSVNIKEVSEVADTISERCDVAITHFESALRNMQTADHILMGRLGDFFSEVMMAPDAAQECYNEGRDIYEARQARSMRGTRQHTSVEIDVQSLKERMISLLFFVRQGGSKGRASTLVRLFAIAIASLLAVLVMCCIILIVIANGSQTDFHADFEAVRCIYSLRLTVSTFAAYVGQFSLPDLEFMLTALTLEVTELVGQFSLFFVFLTAGKGAARSSSSKSIMSKSVIPYYSAQVQNDSGMSLWGFTELYLQAMVRFLNKDSVSAGDGTSVMLFLIGAGAPLSTAFEKYMTSFINNDIQMTAMKWIGWMCCVFVVSLIILATVYVAQMFALRRSALNRVFAVQLFTLIPFDPVETLAMEAKEKYHRIQMAKALRGEGERGDLKPSAMDLTECVVVDAANPAYVGDRGGTVKSCMRRAPQTDQRFRLNKRVRFNPVIQVVGTVEEKKDDGVVVDEDDEAMKLNTRQLRRQQKRQSMEDAAEHQHARHGMSKLCVSFLFGLAVMAAAVTITIATIIMVINRSNKYSPNIDEYTTFQEKIYTTGLSLPKAVQSTLSYIQSGNPQNYQNAQGFLSNLFETIPNLIGDVITEASAVKLVRMDRITQLVANLTVDASAMAALYHGVSLNFSSSAAILMQMSSEGLENHLSLKYPTAATNAHFTVSTYQLPPDTFHLYFAYAILASQSSTLVMEFRQLFLQVVDGVATTAYSDVSMRSRELMISLATSSAAGLLLLLTLVTPLRKVFKQTIPLRLVAASLLSFVLIAILCTLLYSEALDVKTTFENSNKSVYILNTFIDEFLTASENYVAFVLTSASLYWFTAATITPIGAMSALADSMLDHFLSSENAATMTNVLNAGYAITSLHHIAWSLTINCMNLTHQRVETAMSTAADAARWDITAQPNANELRLQYGESLFYTNNTYDLSRPTPDGYATAVRVVSGPQYQDYAFLILDQLRQLSLAFIAGSYQHSISALDNQSALVYITLASCALPCVFAMWLCICVLMRFRQILNLDDESNAGVMNTNPHYHSMMRRARIALPLLALLFGGTFGVGVWITQTTQTYAEALNSASNIGNQLASAVFDTTLIYTPYSTYISDVVATSSIDNIMRALNVFYLLPSKMGVPGALHLSLTHNVNLLGPTDMITRIETVTAYLKAIAPCASGITLVNKTDPLAGVMPPLMFHILSLQEHLLQFLQTEIEFLTLSSPPMEVMQSVIQLELQLLPGIKASNDLIFDSVSSSQTNYLNLFLCLALLTTFATIAVVFVVTVPTIALLIHEENALHMLLHMIPLHVAQSVPAIANYFDTGIIPSSSELQRKFEANEKLLQNILPEKIAARLKSGEQPIADTHDCVTMLFTDFVGFTKRSSTMQAREIVDFLNEVFLEFDTVVELLSLEKIKTIGDAFFMAAGLDAQMRDHALRVVEAGLMFFEALEEHNRRHPSRVPLQMRLGVHSGPVVAGVIGIKKVAYDLWGDSVEIANAMESTGVPGYVHISESTAELVRGFFKLEPRGELPREKEHIPDDMPNTYLVVGRLLPTPYMHLRRPKLGGTVVRQL